MTSIVQLLYEALELKMNENPDDNVVTLKLSRHSAEDLKRELKDILRREDDLK